METQNLRLGNIVDRRFWNPAPNNERYCYENNVVTLISKSNISVSPFNRKEKLRISKNDIVPITLTTEWLIRFGFEEAYNSQFRLKYDHPLMYIGYDFSKTKDKNMEGFRYFGHYIKIKYVHELQNLFFALVGSELSLK